MKKCHGSKTTRPLMMKTFRIQATPNQSSFYFKLLLASGVQTALRFVKCEKNTEA